MAAAFLARLTNPRGSPAALCLAAPPSSGLHGEGIGLLAQEFQVTQESPLLENGGSRRVYL